MSFLASLKALPLPELHALRVEVAEAAHTALMRLHAVDDELGARRRAQELERILAPVPVPVCVEIVDPTEEEEREEAARWGFAQLDAERQGECEGAEWEDWIRRTNA